MAKRIDKDILKLLKEGTVIPAHPLALNSKRELDERYQRALTRYYMDSGAGGIAVAVHTTQFEIRDKDVNLFERVLKLASQEVDRAKLNRPFIKIAGICGPKDQAIEEAKIARDLGYHIGLLSPGGLADLSEDELLDRAREVSKIIPIFGFYLQAAVGGRNLSYDFWREFAEIPGLVAIKIAPFDRYQTLDVVRAVCNSSRWEDIALYTGNDDNIVADLLTSYSFMVDEKLIKKDIVGGLLGHWSVWTQRAVELLDEIKIAKGDNKALVDELLTKGIQITDSNAAFFDAINDFKGCIAGIHEVLRRQGLIEGRYCLNPEEDLSPGQMEEIDRVYKEYPDLNDDDFIKENLNKWLGEIS